MRNALRTASIPSLLMLFVCICIARGADDSGPVSCPESCAGSRKNCELSCSQIVGGGVESGKKRECFGACADEEVSCNERCLNPTPRPTLKPEAYSDESCSGACGFRSRDCKEECTKHVGGGAAGIERAKCENACVNELDKCRGLCVSPTPAPVIDPGVYENNPCSGECSSELEKCEGNCAMFSGEGENGGKRGECMTGCKGAEYNCLEACPR